MFDSLSNEPGNGADYLNPKDLINHLLIIWSIDYVENSPTKFSKPGQPADAVIVDVVDLDGYDPETNQPGRLARGTWWRQGRLIRELKRCLGNQNPKLAWMTQGISTSGYPPYELRDATTDQGAITRATHWMQAHPGFKPSTPSMSGYPVQPVQPMGQPVMGRPPQQPQYNQPPPSQLEQLASRAQQPLPPIPPGGTHHVWTHKPQEPQQGDIPF